MCTHRIDGDKLTNNYWQVMCATQKKGNCFDLDGLGVVGSSGANST
jgi:hypothetical protein